MNFEELATATTDLSNQDCQSVVIVVGNNQRGRRDSTAGAGGGPVLWRRWSPSNRSLRGSRVFRHGEHAAATSVLSAVVALARFVALPKSLSRACSPRITAGSLAQHSAGRITLMTA